MGWFWKKKEERADTSADDVLLRALLNPGNVTRQTALNIPSLNGCIEYIANTISMLPIKLYREKDGAVQEIKDDHRVTLLNDETGDTLDAVQFWKAMVVDYFLGKGGYAYIRKERNQFAGLFYVAEEFVSIQKNSHPIFKDCDFLVNGTRYKPYEFIKILRKTRDGCQGVSLIEESPLILSVGYNTLRYEDELVAKGGSRKGFLQSAKNISQAAMDVLKDAWRKLYSNSEERVVVLNDGVTFKEASATSVEMQMNENKETNSREICKLVNVPESIIKGTASNQEYINGFKLAVMPVIRAIECALNRDFLLEKEKKGDAVYYWAFDSKEMTKGDIKTRYEAYKIAIDSNFMQIDEVRYQEDLPSLGLDWIKLGLDSVLYDPKTGNVYTPNTNQTTSMNNLKGGE